MASTLNPNSGETEAVILPLTILLLSTDGTFRNLLPSPSKNDALIKGAIIALDAVIEPLANNEPLTLILPVNCEPVPKDSTLNPNTGDTDALMLPLAILNTSSDNAERGMSNNPLPLPLYIEAVILPFTAKLPVIFVGPINSINDGLTKASTMLIVPAIEEWNWQL